MKIAKEDWNRIEGKGVDLNAKIPNLDGIKEKIHGIECVLKFACNLYGFDLEVFNYRRETQTIHLIINTHLERVKLVDNFCKSLKERNDRDDNSVKEGEGATMPALGSRCSTS